MAFSTVGLNDRSVPLDIFGGLVTECAPSTLPLGVSPDCRDMEFLPGSAFSRRCLKKVFNSPFGAVGVNYEKSFVDATGVVRNLYLDSAGNIWVENVTAAPGTYSLLATTTAGSYAKSVTAFGREYIAVSNSLHGADVPLQYDGVNLDRWTQDGPGNPPTVSMFTIPPVAMAGTGAPATLAVTEIDPASPPYYPAPYYTQANIYVSSGASAVDIGAVITVSGTNATYNIVYTVVGVYGDTLLVATPPAVFPAGTAFYVGSGTVTVGSGVTMSRAANIVTVSTATAHNLQQGYQAQITGVGAATVGTSISKIVINNENLPGIATVTTSTAHKLPAGVQVSISGVNAVMVGTISSIVRAGQVVTVTTAAAHGLSPGASITITGVTTTSFNTTAAVLTVNSSTVFTFAQVDVDATDSTGSVTLNWPVPDTDTPTYFDVIAAPTTTTFQVSINYSDSPAGGWTSGTVTFAWTGTFYVSSVNSATSFSYQQYGPNATTSTVGTVTPYGQCSPGVHQVQVAFLTRQGYLTRPSPPVKFSSPGGQFIAVGNIPIGPSNVIARCLLFTGAGGSQFYYIPVPAQVTGQQVSSSTVVDDNTTTGTTVDFGDNTLFSSVCGSIAGNNLPAMIVADSALGFGYFASRVFAYGMRNCVTGLLNMGFDGGYSPSAPTIPTGWTSTGGAGALNPGHQGTGWLIFAAGGSGQLGVLSQSMATDGYGAPIAAPNTQYTFRAWLQPTVVDPAISFTAMISSSATSFTSTAVINGAAMSASGSFVEAAFSAVTPVTIPDDLTFTISAACSRSGFSPSVLVDEMAVVFTRSPFQPGMLFSYANNPEAIDAKTSQLGSNSSNPVFAAEEIRNNLYFWTKDPSGRLYTTNDNGTTEPLYWDVSEVASNCGVLSPFGVTVSQADDSSGSGGEEWAAWASIDGAMIFSGGIPEKFSQEIQPDWASINPAAYTRIWAVNDYIGKQIYFGLPTGTAATPNFIYQMTYRQLNSASAISQNGPYKVGFGGKLIATDFTRKWCPWSLAINCCALMRRENQTLVLVFGGNFGNVYTLGAPQGTDDDYGQVSPYYVTAAFVGHDAEAALQLGSVRKTLVYVSAFISGTGTMTITPYMDALTNPSSLVMVRPLIAAPKNEMGCPFQTVAERFFLRLASAPVTGTNNGFNVTHLMAALRKNAHLQIRGAPQS